LKDWNFVNEIMMRSEFGRLRKLKQVHRRTLSVGNIEMPKESSQGNEKNLK
jgi:hypothetical protein